MDTQHYQSRFIWAFWTLLAFLTQILRITLLCPQVKKSGYNLHHWIKMPFLGVFSKLPSTEGGGMELVLDRVFGSICFRP